MIPGGTIRAAAASTVTVNVVSPAKGKEKTRIVSGRPGLPASAEHASRSSHLSSAPRPFSDRAWTSSLQQHSHIATGFSPTLGFDTTQFISRARSGRSPSIPFAFDRCRFDSWHKWGLANAALKSIYRRDDYDAAGVRASLRFSPTSISSRAPSGLETALGQGSTRKATLVIPSANNGRHLGEKLQAPGHTYERSGCRDRGLDVHPRSSRSVFGSRRAQASRHGPSTSLVPYSVQGEEQ